MLWLVDHAVGPEMEITAAAKSPPQLSRSSECFKVALEEVATRPPSCAVLHDRTKLNLPGFSHLHAVFAYFQKIGTIGFLPGFLPPQKACREKVGKNSLHNDCRGFGESKSREIAPMKMGQQGIENGDFSATILSLRHPKLSNTPQ